MATKISLPKYMCEDAIVEYIACRYHTSPLNVITRFFEQEGILTAGKPGNSGAKFDLQENELAIFRALGIPPSEVELCENAVASTKST